MTSDQLIPMETLLRLSRQDLLNVELEYVRWCEGPIYNRRITGSLVHRAGIRTIGELLEWPRWKLAQIENLGRKTLNQIEAVLAKLGLSLSERTPAGETPLEAELRRALRSIESLQIGLGRVRERVARLVEAEESKRANKTELPRPSLPSGAYDPFVDEMGMSVRCVNALHNMGVERASDIFRVPASVFQKRFGKKTFEAIQNEMDPLGVTFQPE